MCEDNVIRLPISPVRGGPVSEDAEFVGRETYDIAWAMLMMIAQHISGYVMPLPIYGQPIDLKRIAEDGSVVTTTYRLK